MAHTPGPWVVEYGVDSQPIVVHQCRDICTVDTRDGDDNARLIAAAPELLAFAETVKSYCILNRKEGSVLFKEAIAVIANAKGGA